MKRSCLISLTARHIRRRCYSYDPPACHTDEGLNTTSILYYRMFQEREISTTMTGLTKFGTFDGSHSDVFSLGTIKNESFRQTQLVYYD